MPRLKSQTKRLLITKSLILLLITATLLALLVNVQQITDLLGRATAEPANITVNTQAIIEPLPRPWRNLAQGGESADWRMEPVAEHVRPLNPEYIRIDHVFDFYDIVQGSSGNLSFDFSKFDLILDDILAVGAKPYIALSYMPPAIAEDDVVSAPRNYAEWQFVVQRLIEHVSGTRGIPDVYYEVWNEPDLFGGWKYYGNRNYLTLYSYAAQGARQARVSQQFKIGGPATTQLYKNWFDALAEHSIENNLRLDFLSWHRYSTDVNDFRHDMINARTWLQSYPQLGSSVELHLTEWGHDSANHVGYDNMFGAAHTTAAGIEMIGVVDRAFVFEIQDGKDPAGQQLWGRWGLMTHNDVGLRLKPRYRALEMLEELAPLRLEIRGKGTYVKAVASRDIDGRITLVLVNYDAWGRNRENVPVTLTNLESGAYTVRTRSLSNAPTTQQMTVEADTLTTTIPMSAQEIIFVEVTSAF
ncbi:MAG: hypothetical protein WDZ94_02805 [Patescibacteria group bacterium]